MGAEPSDDAIEMADDPDLSQVDQVWLGSGDSVSGEQFVAALDALTDLQDSLEDIRDTLADMNTGLDQEDTIRLIKGRNPNTALGDIRAFFEAVNTVIDAEPSEIAPRLIASKAGNMTIEEAAELFAELVDLAEKYGSLNDQTDDTDQP